MQTATIRISCRQRNVCEHFGGNLISIPFSLQWFDSRQHQRSTEPFRASVVVMRFHETNILFIDSICAHRAHSIAFNCRLYQPSKSSFFFCRRRRWLCCHHCASIVFSGSCMNNPNAYHQFYKYPTVHTIVRWRRTSMTLPQFLFLLYFSAMIII